MKTRLFATLTCAATAFALLLAVPALGYKIFLKDGTSFASRAKFEVQNESAVFVVDNGTLQSVPLSLVDLERTEQYNSDPRTSRQLDSAVVIGRDGAKPLDLDLLRDRSGASEGIADQVRRAKRAPEAAPSDRLELRKTTAGYEDFTAQPRLPIVDIDQARALENVIRRTGLNNFTVFRGTTLRRPFIEVTTSTAGETLDVLLALAQATQALAAERPDVEALEVLLRTPQRTRAGQFVLDKNNVADLVEGRITPGEYFIRHVQF